MSATTQPVFIVGTGRCGTRALYKILLGTPGVEVHHEYLCTHVQQIAALYAMERLHWRDAMTKLEGLYGAAVALTDADIWIDSSNKASWLIGILLKMFPRAKFVALFRDGRNVVSSFFHKLAAECYDDRSVAAMRSWLNCSGPMPPPEKKFWWHIPQSTSKLLLDGRFAEFDQFQRMCYHWAACNDAIMMRMICMPPDTYMRVKLEDLVSDPAQVERLARFIGIEPRPEYFAALQRPQGVIVPQDFELTAEQEKQFWAICRPMMEVLDYADRPSYRVKY